MQHLNNLEKPYLSRKRVAELEADVMLMEELIFWTKSDGVGHD